MDTSGDAPQQVNIVKSSAPSITIRGLAGPFSVMAQNFAPGTTAADIESAMTPVGGEMVGCKIIKTQPIMIVEMSFVSREGGERVIEMFNDKTVSAIQSLFFYLFIETNTRPPGRWQTHQGLPQDRRLPKHQGPRALQRTRERTQRPTLLPRPQSHQRPSHRRLNGLPRSYGL